MWEYYFKYFQKYSFVTNVEGINLLFTLRIMKNNFWKSYFELNEHD
jgi:hypothetical protein